MIVSKSFLYATTVIIFTSSILPAQGTPWRYGLRSGDHLVYRYTFQKHTQGEDGSESQAEVRFRTHVLVIGENDGRLSVGFQRNRESAELTLSRRKGKDRLAQDRVDFDNRMRKRQSRFSEAQEISRSGDPHYSWEMARETYSHVLDAIHEVMSLPPIALKKGEAWRGSSVLGFDLRWVDDETVHEKSCHRVEGSSADGSLKLNYCWSSDSTVLEQIGLEATYGAPGGTLHEIVHMELDGFSHAESLDTWLGSAETRLGTLQALLLSPGVAIAGGQLSPILTSDDAAAQALSLAVAVRRKMAVPPEIAAKLKESNSTPVRILSEELSKADGSVPQLTSVDECKRPVAAKPVPSKFGTIYEAVRATRADTEIPYLLRVPLTYRADRPSPLLVYLSGGAGFAIDGVNTAEEVVAQTEYLVLYPQAGQYWWTPEMARRFDAVFRQVVSNYNVDFDRVYLTGFSNGGTGSLYFAEMWPQRFAAVVSQMGAGLCVEAVKAGLTNLGDLPLLFVHGDKDPRIGSECSTTTHSALLDMRLPVKPEIKILPGREHDITLQTDDGLTLAFFRNKVRNPFPREIEANLLDTQASRQYWIEVVDAKTGKAGVEARVKSDNTVDIHTHDVKRMRVHLRPEMFSKPGEMRIQWNGKKLENGPLKDVCSAATSGVDPKLDRADVRELSSPW